MHTCALLHVEDQDSYAFLFRAALDEAGIAVSVYRVSDGEQALAFLTKSGPYRRARTPEVVVLDLNMPKVDGWMVLAALQASKELKSIPVVVCSDSTVPGNHQRVLDIGARKYLVKPSELDELISQVRTICVEFLPLPA